SDPRSVVPGAEVIEARLGVALLTREAPSLAPSRRVPLLPERQVVVLLGHRPRTVRHRQHIPNSVQVVVFHHHLTSRKPRQHRQDPATHQHPRATPARFSPPFHRRPTHNHPAMTFTSPRKTRSSRPCRRRSPPPCCWSETAEPQSQTATARSRCSSPSSSRS